VATALRAVVEEMGNSGRLLIEGQLTADSDAPSLTAAPDVGPHLCGQPFDPSDRSGPCGAQHHICASRAPHSACAPNAFALFVHCSARLVASLLILRMSPQPLTYGCF
jgi:hypothetical protein